MPNCSFIRDNEIVCANINGLNSFFFFDPVNNHLEKTTICQIHSDEILGIMLEEIKYIQRTNMKLKNQIELHKTARKQDIFYDDKNTFSEIQSNFDRINRIRWQFCRWPLCENRRFFNDEMVYSTIIYSIRGKLRHIFYFHFSCWQKFKARCGIMTAIQRGQKTLEMINN